MMKKILLLAAAGFSLNALAQTPKIEPKLDGVYNPMRTFEPSQNNNAALVSTVDTLHYFFNKHYYRNSSTPVPPATQPPNVLFYTIPTPYTTTLSLTYCGSVFSNSTSIFVSGLEGIVARRPGSVSANVPVKLYLCNLNSSNLPIFPPLDSVITSVSSAQNGAWIGGNFANPVNVTGRFAVLIKNASTLAGDTIAPFMNNASTAASTVAVNQRYGENFGLMRVNGNFQTTNQSFAGSGPDYEFLVAPRVSFDFDANISVLTPSICTNSSGSFSNATVPAAIVEHRQFNFNKFVLHWRGPVMSPLLNNLVPPTDSIYEWQFTGSPSPISYQKNPTVTFNSSGNQTAQLTVNYKPSVNAGLLNTVSDIETANINVSTNAAPVVAVSGATALCAGNSTTLTASGNPSNTYTWTIPATTSPFIIVNPNATTVYTVSAENAGCIGSRTITVIVSQPANVNVTGPSQACVGSIFTLQATGANSYSWSTSSTSSFITVSAQNPGTVTYTVTGVNNGCPPSIQTHPVNINALPSTQLTASTNVVCSKAQGGQAVTLTGAPAGGSYSGLNVSNGQFNPNTTGTFVISYNYTDPNTSCSKTATTSIVVSACTGIAGNELNANLSVYPNPAVNGKLQVKGLEGMNTVSVYNILGVLVHSQVSTAPEVELDLSSKAQGNYFIRITDNNGGVKTVKIVNQH